MTENAQWETKIKEVKPTYEQLAKALETEIEYRQQLEAEVIQLRKFANYVRSCKSKQDFWRLRNVILAANQKFKWRS